MIKLEKNIYSNTMDFLRRRFIELFGVLLLGIFLIFLYSLINYSPNNSTLIYNIDTGLSNNTLELYSNVVADFFLQSFGLISFLICITILSWGINLIIKKKIKNFLNKIFYTISYILLGCLFVYQTNNNSFWLIDNGNSGFVGESIFNLFENYIPFIENNILKIILLFFTLTFFILASGINLSEILKKILKNKNKSNQIENYDITDNEPSEGLKAKQQSFSFKTSKESMVSKKVNISSRLKNFWKKNK